jgi:hypothetical protein
MFDQSTPAPPRQNGSNGNGQQQHRAQPQTQPQAADREAQKLADEAHAATSPQVIENILERAGKAGKLGKTIRNPASGRIGELAVYLNWRHAQARTQADAFEKAVARLGDSPWADSVRDLADVEQARRLITEVDGVDMDAAKRHLVRDAILIKFPGAGDAGQRAA